MSPLEALIARAGDAVLRLFDEADEARLLMSPARDIVLVNKSCEKLFGRRRDELIGAPGRLLTPPRLGDDYDRVYAALMATQGAGSVGVNLWVLDRTGREFPVRIIARLITLEPGDQLLSLVVLDRATDGAGRELREFLEAVHDGNLITDREGRIVMTSAKLLEIFGYDEEELLGQPVEMLMPKDRRRLHEAVRARFTGRAQQHPMALGTQVVAQRKDGTTFPVRVLLSSLGREDDVLVSASIRDLTEVEELRGESDRLKDQFLANVSHELRTPLTSIMGSAEMLADEIARIEDDALRRRLERYSAMISRGARRQLALVEDLLTLTSLDRGGVATEEAMADLFVVVENVVHDYLPRANAAGVALVAEDASLPVLVPADERWIGRAVDCLVSNAVKFTPPGGQVVVRAGAEGDLAWLEVVDTGPGIDEDEAALVFRRLYRGRAAVSGVKPGAGLGLAIARSVVAASGGTLRVVPGEGGGARLRIELPVARGLGSAH